MSQGLTRLTLESATIPENSMAPPGQDLISGRSIMRNTVWSFVGTTLPAVVAIFSIPFLTRTLGAEQFGLLTLAWAIIGQLNLFDLGLGRALTKLVATRLGAQQIEEIPALFWASFLFTVALGALAALLVLIFSPLLVHKILKIPLVMQLEALRTFYLVAAAMPAMVTTISLRGFLEGCHRFDLLNKVRIPTSLFSYLAPLGVLPFSHRLVPVMIVLVVSRWLGIAAYFWACARVFPSLRHKRSPQGAPLREMFSFGGWMTVTNLVAPILVTFDRFVIAGMLSVTAVAYYATPFEAVTRLLILPGVIVSVLFPAFSALVVQGPHRTVILFERSLRYVFVTFFPLILLLVGFSREGLQLWLGGAYAENSTRVLQYLSIGVFFNSMGFIPAAQVQGSGRPDATAKLCLLELPVYLFTLWALVHHFGIVGAAIAWLLRAAIDSVLLLILTWHVLPAAESAVRRQIAMMLAAGGLLAIPIFWPGFWSRMAYVTIVAAISVAVGWLRLLTSQERRLVFGWLAG